MVDCPVVFFPLLHARPLVALLAMMTSKMFLPQVFEKEMESIQKEVIALAAQNSQLSELIVSLRMIPVPHFF